MKYYLHSNGDAANHGCEAILRSTIKVLQLNKFDVGYPSYNVRKDIQYGLDELVNILPCSFHTSKHGSLNYYFDAFVSKYISTDFIPEKLSRDIISYAQKDNYAVALSMGGDNYCYKNGYYNLGYKNKQLKKNINKSFLWGASIEADVITIPRVIKDLNLYDGIFARESITYNNLLDKNIKTPVFLYPDPAFILPVVPVDLPNMFKPYNTVGINISPLILSLENRTNIAYDNFKELIKYILKETNFSIALIPHVVWEYNDDRNVLKMLKNEFKDEDRIILIEDANCMQLKYIISRCKYFIGARTHATIAAYSSCVPTLVVGYSVKAKGIAKDLFGRYENYVLSVQDLVHKGELVKAFEWIITHDDEIQTCLKLKMPNYINRILNIKTELNKLIEK